MINGTFSKYWRLRYCCVEQVASESIPPGRLQERPQQQRQQQQQQQQQTSHLQQFRSQFHSHSQSQSRTSMVAPAYDVATDSTTVAEITARLDNSQADALAELRSSGAQLTMMGGAGKHADMHEAVKVLQAGLLRYGNEGRWRPAFHRFELDSGGDSGGSASQIAAGSGLTIAEFVALLRREETRLTPTVVSDATLLRLLEAFDLNGDGMLSWDEFRALLHYRQLGK